MTPLSGWEPDRERVGENRLWDLDAVPTVRGYAGAPELSTIWYTTALTAQCRGAAILENTSGTQRTFSGTQTGLFEAQTAWTSVARGGGYTGTSDNRWIFAQFGNVALATNDTEKIQWSTSGAFADVTAAPTARVIFTMDNFVMALNTNDPTNGDRPDGWACSAYQDYSSWTASVTTQATNGRLIGAGGELTAGKRLGPYAVAYKSRSIFVGSYVGAPIVWQWERIPGDIGCIGPDAVCDIDGAHIFVGEDNIWKFDGTRPVSISDGICTKWFYDNTSRATRKRAICRFDRATGSVWIFFPSWSATTYCDKALIYNIKTGKWGKHAIDVEAVVDGLIYTTPSSAIESSFLGVFNTSHELRTLSDTSTVSSFRFCDIGDYRRVTTLRRVLVSFYNLPSTGSLSSYKKMSPSDLSGQLYDIGVNSSSMLGGGISSRKPTYFDVRQTAHWHWIDIGFTGSVELIGIEPVLVDAGER